MSGRLNRAQYRLQQLYYYFRVTLTTLTFIGVAVHEWAHKKLCERYRIPVHEVVYFQFDDPPGYVEHAWPKRYRDTFRIATAPFFFNTGLGTVGFYVAFTLLFAVDSLPIWVWPPDPVTVTVAVSLWFGASCGLHAIPSEEDAGTIWTQTKEKLPWNPFVLLGVPVIALIVVVNKLRVLGADIAYAAGLAAVVAYAVQSAPLQ